MARKFQSAGQTNANVACAYSASTFGERDNPSPGGVPASYRSTTERPRYYSLDAMDQGANFTKGNK